MLLFRNWVGCFFDLVGYTRTTMYVGLSVFRLVIFGDGNFALEG